MYHHARNTARLQRSLQIKRYSLDCELTRHKAAALFTLNVCSLPFRPFYLCRFPRSRAHKHIRTLLCILMYYIPKEILYVIDLSEDTSLSFPAVVFLLMLCFLQLY